ncbi:MAG: class I SAM-dependent rRNA methyltransferase [Ignavibacteriaceae bacterium]
MKAQLFLKRNEDKRIRNGHLWIFSNEVSEFKGDAENGELVEIYDSRQNFLGEGFFNKNSLITVRILSGSKIISPDKYLEDKLKSAFDLRKQLYPDRNSFRLVFSESDFLPGLIIDKYNDTYVLQIYSAGIQKNIDIIIKILKNEFRAKNIFTKNESHFRKLEFLPDEDEIFLGEKREEVIDDGSIKYKINFEKGHKTGFYYDQSDNRFFLEKFAKDKSILDGFCNSGGFGLHAIKAGAKSVTFLDSSAFEIDNVKYNFELNKFTSQVYFVVDDVFNYLEKTIAEQKKYDIIVIDPPAFAKSKKKLSKAKKGYEKLNRLAIQSINDNGFLVSSSCSHHLKKDDFIQVINSAAVKSGKALQLIHYNSASLDHPQIPSMEETTYLKFAVFKVRG